MHLQNIHVYLHPSLTLCTESEWYNISLNQDDKKFVYNYMYNCVVVLKNLSQKANFWQSNI